MMRAFTLTEVILSDSIEDGSAILKLEQDAYEGENDNPFVDDTVLNSIELAVPAETVEDMGGVLALVPGSKWDLVLIPSMDAEPTEYGDEEEGCDEAEEIEVEEVEAVESFENEGGAVPASL